MFFTSYAINLLLLTVERVAYYSVSENRVRVCSKRGHIFSQYCIAESRWNNYKLTPMLYIAAWLSQCCVSVRIYISRNFSHLVIISQHSNRAKYISINNTHNIKWTRKYYAVSCPAEIGQNQKLSLWKYTRLFPRFLIWQISLTWFVIVDGPHANTPNLHLS